MKFRKKPVVVDAVQWFREGDNPDVKPYVDEKHLIVTGAICEDDGEIKGCGRLLIEHGSVKTLEGWHIVCPSDWIIKGVKGEFYPCKPDIFELTYEKVD